jgi:hypothetical protein
VVAGGYFSSNTPPTKPHPNAGDGRRFLSTSSDRTIRLWDTAARQCARVFAGHTDQVFAVAFHPDGRRIASASPRSMPPYAPCCDDPHYGLKWEPAETSLGYHHQYLEGGFDNVDITTRFDRAMKAKRYQSVLRSNGKQEKAYAARDPMEYFAEATEAYFGSNDFYPFVRSELRRHDPGLFELLKKLWGDG